MFQNVGTPLTIKGQIFDGPLPQNCLLVHTKRKIAGQLVFKKRSIRVLTVHTISLSWEWIVFNRQSTDEYLPKTGAEAFLIIKLFIKNFNNNFWVGLENDINTYF